MNPAELREEIAIELEAMEMTVDELLALQRDVTGRDLTIREKTAAAAFLTQFAVALRIFLSVLAASTRYRCPAVKLGT